MEIGTLIDKIFAAREVTDAAGNKYPLHSEVDAAEGRALRDLIASDPGISTTLEVGCAFAISTLHICDALQARAGASHTALDPFQSTQWRGVGRANIERAGIAFARIVEERSEVAMPRLLLEQEGGFDLVFIDGLHTYDQTMLDLYYANRLIRVGGYIAVDDCNAPAVAKAVSAIAAFPAYRVIDAMREPMNWRRWIKRGVRVALPVSRAQWLLPAAVFDRFYMRTLYQSFTVLQKIKEDARSHWWARTF